jgi:hypothetical protein
VHRRTLLGALAGGTATATAGCLGFVYPATAGTVHSKVVLGQEPGTARRGILASSDSTGVSVDVEDDSLAAALRGDGERLVVGSDLAGRLEAAYDRVAYRVDLELSAPDPVNGVRPGETPVYDVDRATFNAAVVDTRVEARVARFGEYRLASVTVPGSDESRGNDGGLSGTGA